MALIVVFFRRRTCAEFIVPIDDEDPEAGDDHREFHALGGVDAGRWNAVEPRMIEAMIYDGVGLEQVRGHAGAELKIVAHVVGDRGRVVIPKQNA